MKKEAEYLVLPKRLQDLDRVAGLTVWWMEVHQKLQGSSTSEKKSNRRKAKLRRIDRALTEAIYDPTTDCNY